MKRIFVDLDGVLADYMKKYMTLGGGRDDNSKRRRVILKKDPMFFHDLELMPDAMQLWNYVLPFDPYILSAQSNFVPGSRSQKYAWVETNLNMVGEKVIVVDYPSDKYKYCTSEDDILIDDKAKNCSDWGNAGGRAILHKSSKKTIEELAIILGV